MKVMLKMRKTYATFSSPWWLKSWQVWWHSRKAWNQSLELTTPTKTNSRKYGSYLYIFGIKIGKGFDNLKCYGMHISTTRLQTDCT